MLNAVLSAVGVFVIVFGVLRLVERGYHRYKRTPDWSPHWGSWVFALLCGLAILLSDLGRSA